MIEWFLGIGGVDIEGVHLNMLSIVHSRLVLWTNLYLEMPRGSIIGEREN